MNRGFVKRRRFWPERLCALVLAALLLLAALAGCGTSSSGSSSGQAGGSTGSSKILRVGLVPNQAPDKVKAEYEPLRKYLSKKLGRPVELYVPTGYPAVVEAMASGKLDLALFGGLTYVQARQQTKVTPLVTDVNPRTKTTKYHSAIIVPAKSSVRKVSQLKGKDFAFGSVSSTSGSLYPAIMLQKAGINFRTDLGQYTYTNGHDATAAAVSNGSVDGGGLEYRILLDLEANGTVDPKSVRVIKTSAPIEGYPWVVRNSLPNGLKQSITNAFLDMKDPKLLDLLHASGYERVKPSDYDYIAREARRFDLLTVKQ